VFGRRDVVFLNKGEMARRNLQEGDLVDLVTAGQFARADRVCANLTLVEYNLPDQRQFPHHRLDRADRGGDIEIER
jgi:anaerobic selenocysteine-containing dehydrogenase